KPLETNSVGNVYMFLNKLRTSLSKKLNPEPHSVFLSSGTVQAINKSRIQVEVNSKKYKLLR
ncbi:MAG: hypothetical protein KAG53_07310, partial [Endozoicomonadaceae bacterium]|nr:hypothetical protein [Endozoicomonadaceae bacterium]